MKKITLKNDYHNTSVTVLVLGPHASSPAEAWEWIQYRAMVNPQPADLRRYRRVNKALCGMVGCHCGTVRP